MSSRGRRWLDHHGLCSRRLLAGSVATVFAVDALLWLTAPPLLLDGLTDWAAHAATALLVLALMRNLSATFIVGVLAGAVLIDLDHVPQYLGTEILTKGTPRPYTHSLLTLVVLGLLAWRTRDELRQLLSGATLGLALHLVRDMAEPGPNGGIALFWPISDWGARIPYVVYAGAVLALFVVAWLRCPGGREDLRRCRHGDHICGDCGHRAEGRRACP